MINTHHRLEKKENRLKNMIPGNGRKILIVGVIIILILFIFNKSGTSMLPTKSSDSSAENSSNQKMPESSEIAAIKATQNLDEQVKLYTKLLERVGPAEAQAEIRSRRFHEVC